MIPEITRRYLAGRTLAEFAAGLGSYISRQSVHQWAKGIYVPGRRTMLRILESPKAEPWAKEFAQECLEALHREGEILENDSDIEIEPGR